MAKLFLESTDTTYKVSTANTKVFGATGSQVVTVDAAATGVTFDANVEGVSFSGATSDFTYKQIGLTDLGVYRGTDLIATVAIQDDATTEANGSLLSFSNGTVSAKFATTGSVVGLTLGGAAISAASATTVTPTSFVSTTGNGTTPTPVTGQTFTLTSSGDTFDPTNATAAYKTTTGDDTFRAPSNNNLDSADFIDGGAGTDALTASITANDHTIAPMIKNVESITLTVAAVDEKTFTFDAADVTGATTVTIRNAGAVGYSTTDELISVTNLAKTTTLGIVGGTESSGVTSSQITATFASAAAADTQNVAISTLGKVGILTLATAETVSIAATGTGTTGENTIGSLAASAVKTLNITGSGDLTIAASNLADTVTVNASTATGAITFVGEAAVAITKLTFTGGTGASTVTAGASSYLTGTAVVTTNAGADTVDVTYATIATVNVGDGNDSVIVGAQANITAADSIVGGAGTDKIVITDATINATTKTTLALGVSGFEVVKTTATAATTIDFNALSSYDIVEVAGTHSLSAGGGATSGGVAAAGLDAVTATLENADTLIISADITAAAGGTGTASGGRGGDSITLTPRLDNGSNVANLTLIGDVDLTGGAGGIGAGAGSTNGSGDSAIDAVSIEVLNIKLQGTETSAGLDLAFIAGAAGVSSASSPGAAGDTVVVGSNATINVTDELVGTATKYNNLDMGTVAGQNVTINASTFHGTLKVGVVSSDAGNVAIYGGSAADTLTGGTGADVISGGAGADSITGGTGADVLTGGADVDTFAFGSTGSVSGTAQDEITDFAKASDILSFSSVTVLAAETNGTTATSDVDTTTGGKISFAPADDTFDEMVTAILADSELEATGSTAFFEFGGDTYVYNAGNSGSATDDQIIKLTGVTGLVTITDLGTTLTIA